MRISFNIERGAGKEPIAEKSAVRAADDHLWNTVDLPSMGIPATRRVNEYLKEFVSWTAANIRAIAQPVSEMEFHLKQLKPNNDVVDVEEHPLLDLLYRPNPYMVKSDFLKLITAYYLMAGEAPVRLRRKDPMNMREEPYEMWPLLPGDIRVMVAKANGFEILTGYKYKAGNEEEDLKPWEVMFPTTPNPNNKWRGAGIVEQAAGTIDSLDYSEAYNLNFFKNSAVPYVVLQTDQVLNQTILERLVAGFNGRYQGIQNAYKTAILDAGLKVANLQSTHKDMDFLEQQRFMRDKLMAMFGNTKIALGLVEDVNRANAEASEYVHAKNAVRPMMRTICEYLNEFLLPVFDKTGTLFLTFTDPVPTNRELELQEDIAACDRWATKNEIREKRGLPPIDGGDVIYQSTTLQPLGGDIPLPEPKKYVAPGLQTVRNMRYREDVMRLKNRNVKRKRMKRDIEKMIRDALKTSKPSTHSRNPYRNHREKATIDMYTKNALSIMDRHELKLSEAVGLINAEQEKQVLKKLSNSGKSLADTYMFDRVESVKFGIDLMTPLIEALLLEQGEEAMKLLGLPKPYVMMEAARTYLYDAPRRSLTSMTDTAYDQVRKSIAEALENGESMTKIKARVRAEYQQLTEIQARRVSATETARATNFAQLDAYRQSGVVSGKKWLLAGDACPVCREVAKRFNAKGVSLDTPFYENGSNIEYTDDNGNAKTFVVDYGDVEAPPLHVSCKCVTAPVLTDDMELSAPEHEEKVVIKEVKTAPTNEELLATIDAELAKLTD